MKYIFSIILIIYSFLVFAQNHPPTFASVCCDQVEEPETVLETFRAICYEARGYNNVIEYQSGVVITPLGNGYFDVDFVPPHPQGTSYTVTWGAIEDANRDVPKQHIVRGTRTANGFEFYNTVDDNGTGADIPNVDSGWEFHVTCEKTIEVFQQ